METRPNETMEDNTMNQELTLSDLDFILESLRYTKLRFEEYDRYPSYEYKQGRINDVQEVIAKVQSLRDEVRKDAS